MPPGTLRLQPGHETVNNPPFPAESNNSSPPRPERGLPRRVSGRGGLARVWSLRWGYRSIREKGFNGVTAHHLTHLRQLEAESIHIIREVAAEFEKPVMLYSIGKDSSVLVRLAMKAFHPAPLPFPLLHVDTTWKFHDMIAFRDRFVKENHLDLI